MRDSANGHIAFNCPLYFHGILFEDIRLEFKNGRIVQATANQTEQFNSMLDLDENARYLGEFAMGVNNLLTRPMKDILFDEKIGGSIHLAAGNSYATTRQRQPLYHPYGHRAAPNKGVRRRRGLFRRRIGPQGRQICFRGVGAAERIPVAHRSKPAKGRIMKILSLDFGTSSLKLAVVDEGLHILRALSCPYEYRVYDVDKVEMDPTLLLGALHEGTALLGDMASQIDAIVFCTYSPSGVYMDKAGELRYPVITHLDRRAKPQSRQIVEEFGAERFQRITGILPFVGGRVGDHAQMDAGQPARTSCGRFGPTRTLPTWLYHRMTDVLATDPVNASMTGMYRTVDSSGWSEEILSALGIDPGLLPPIYRAGEALGALRPEMAALCGLKSGIPVALGTNDMAAALVGAGCTKSGMALNVCGSSEMVSVLTHEPVPNNRYYLRRSAIDGLWQCYSTMVGGFGLGVVPQPVLPGDERARSSITNT